MMWLQHYDSQTRNELQFNCLREMSKQKTSIIVITNFVRERELCSQLTNSELKRIQLNFDKNKCANCHCGKVFGAHKFSSIVFSKCFSCNNNWRSAVCCIFFGELEKCRSICNCIEPQVNLNSFVLLCVSVCGLSTIYNGRGIRGVIKWASQ